MNNITIKDINGKTFSANVLFAFSLNKTKKNYIVLNNSNEIFKPDSSYTNLDVFEIINEQNNTFYVSDILDEEWETIQELLLEKLLSKI